MSRIIPIDRRCVFHQIYSDLQKTLDINPHAFDCLLFKANLNALEHLDKDDVVGNLESREETFSYSSPTITRAIELPNDSSSIQMMALGDGTDEGEDLFLMLIKELNVPEQSVLWIEEQINDETIHVRLLYIIKAEPIGKNGSGGFKYHLMPFDVGSDFLPDKFRPETGEPIEFLPNPYPEPSLTGVVNKLSQVANKEKIAALRQPVPMVNEQDEVNDDNLNKQAVDLQEKVGTIADIFDVF
ncbi:hypothetical protein PXH59_00425 (plasmid) [Xenorhabdus sp. SF857]|uniref:hypothetical protein n=1 Tax=Xenorhabdus bakwenae TaxID=3026967 RepID=UPI002557C99C|nr:hypothetical protein [Xenorhabdus sp. SF857]WFQ78146.1 hypothetical protein PXH59_00425 [Xenorhabdus sp. SF857]